MEEWEPILGFPGYSISNLGRVRRDVSGRILHVKVNQYGIPYVGLMRDSEQWQRSLALLVAKAFLPNPTDFFDTPINLDGDRFNCEVDNLMWRPRWFAVRYNQQFTQDAPQRAQNTPIRAIETGEAFGSPMAAAQRYGLLEHDVLHSIRHHTVTWPNYIRFEVVE